MPASSYVKSFALVASAFTVTPFLVSQAIEHVPALRAHKPSVALSLVSESKALAAPTSPALAAPVGLALGSFTGLPRATERLDSLSSPAPAGAALAAAAAALAPATAPAPTFAAPAETPPAAASTGPRVELENINTGERASFAIAANGFVPPDELAAVTRFFRCRRTGRSKPMSTGVLSLLGDVARRFPNRIILVVSGYRAPPYGVPHSRHFKGMAIDLRVSGVRTALVRDYLWREHSGVGVGYYTHGNFVHIDWRPDHGDTAWSARQEGGKYDYNPRWAKRARRARSAAPALTMATMAPAVAAR